MPIRAAISRGFSVRGLRRQAREYAINRLLNHQRDFLSAHNLSEGRAGSWTSYGSTQTGVQSVYFDFWLTYLHVRFGNSTKTYTYTLANISMRVAATAIGRNSGLTRYLTQGTVVHSPVSVPASVRRVSDRGRQRLTGPIRGGSGGGSRRSRRGRRRRGGSVPRSAARTRRSVRRR